MEDNKIVIEDYNPDWVFEFEKISEFLKTDLFLNNIRIEHIGSTSVVGLPAKPIIDIDIVVKIEDKQQAFEAICNLGYYHLGDLGIIGREAFRLVDNDQFMRHNLYLCEESSLAIKNHLAWRNYLRSSKELCTEYARLKRDLALRYPADIDRYCSAKTDFIIAGLARFLPEKDITKIREQNML